MFVFWRERQPPFISDAQWLKPGGWENCCPNPTSPPCLPLPCQYSDVKQGGGGGGGGGRGGGLRKGISPHLSTASRRARSYDQAMERLVGLVVEASASRAADLTSIPAFAMDLFFFFFYFFKLESYQ